MSVPQLSHVSVWSAFCLPVYVSSLVLFHPLSLQSVMYLFIPSPSVYHVLVLVSVCVTSHLICPYVLICTYACLFVQFYFLCVPWCVPSP